MKLVRITKEARAAIESAALYPMEEVAFDHGDGTVSIKLSDETIDRLDGFKFEGETMSDAIIRLVTTYRGFQ